MLDTQGVDVVEGSPGAAAEVLVRLGLRAKRWTPEPSSE
jgi:hypothetical protein